MKAICFPLGDHEHLSVKDVGQGDLARAIRFITQIRGGPSNVVNRICLPLGEKTGESATRPYVRRVTFPPSASMDIDIRTVAAAVTGEGDPLARRCDQSGKASNPGSFVSC
jgi:hypothetical protein